MEYQKYDLDKYNLHIINTDRFKKVSVLINFKRKIKKEDMTIRRLLSDCLLESSLKYPSRRHIDMEVEDLYGISITSNTFTSGNYDILSFKATFLNEAFTESGMNKKSIMFLLELLLNPDVKNNSFNDYCFDLGKRIIKNEIKTFNEYPPNFAHQRMLEVMDKNCPISYRGCGYLKDLNKITKEDLYDYYKSVINDDIIDIVVIGNINEDDVIKLFKENFTRINKNKDSESHFIKINTKKIKEKTEKAKINQSRLVIGCTVDTDNLYDIQYVLNFYSFILGGSGDSLLFKTVREENSLCYHISSSYNVISNLLTIKAGIDASNKDKTIKLIKECMDKMKNGEFNDSEVEKARIIYKNSCIEMFDNEMSLANNYMSHEYLKTDLLADRIKNIDNITKDMVVDIANKVSINTIYMLEGENND